MGMQLGQQRKKVKTLVINKEDSSHPANNKDGKLQGESLASFRRKNTGIRSSLQLIQHC